MRSGSTTLVTGAFVFVAMSAIGFVPLFGGPGYEHALATGLVVPVSTAVATALHVSRARDGSPLASVARGVGTGLAFTLVSALTAALHALRVGVCEISGAVLYFALTAAVGSMLGGAWGAFVGEIVRAWRPRWSLAAAGAVAGPFAGVVVSVWRFYTSPMIFAFDPFVGYFSGTLYDTVIDAGPALLTYRLGSLATLVAAGLLASVVQRRADGRPRGFALDVGGPGAKVRALLGVLAAVASLTITGFGHRLGHYSTPGSIAKDLGAEKHGARCDVVYPSTVREQEALLLVKDCDEELAAVERALGTRGPARIRAYFFRDAEDKKRLMGAAHTYIAKPWREEVYLQLGGYPHPVLGHEIAHVVAGSFGRGPFRISGDLGGILPNPGLIEGVAVAASPDDEDLTDAQWALAMKRIGILPPMSRVFSLGFLGDASAKSYTLAGAFVAWIGQRHGYEVVRKWYGGADLGVLVGKDWGTLDAEFRSWLDTLTLAPEAESFARAKFGRPGLFGRRCPHVVDALRHEADQCKDTQRYERAVQLYDEALSKDALDYGSKKERAVVLRRHLDAKAGVAELERLATTESVPRVWRDRAEESLADADFVDGRYESAARRYEGLASRSLDEDAARTLEVKALGARDPGARPAIAGLLLGDAKHGAEIFVGGLELGAWSAREDSRLAAYLIGRNLLQRGFYERGAEVLDRALAGPLPTPRIAREALRQRAIAGCAMRDVPALERVKAVFAMPDDPFRGASGGRRAATLRLIDRCLAP